jgi:phospholipid:diacylglycerol acyltransferase
MCAPKNGAWTKHRDIYNPGHSPIKTKEYVHEESDGKLNVRGGTKTADHVDILGNWDMTVGIKIKCIHDNSKATHRYVHFLIISWIYLELSRTLVKM